jgi:hypothetical protein
VECGRDSKAGQGVMHDGMGRMDRQQQSCMMGVMG